ncbi:hypothetical protein DY000_02040855 [Brassica cretica]|uniref:Uncharacterized protein n=1 Tax=Brassica cretica TaxID=69181 RepID=A0ABQ7B9H3_BRACR|nr:hypothetical protein DY000_02040855 [Brassica cretica]
MTSIKRLKHGRGVLFTPPLPRLARAVGAGYGGPSGSIDSAGEGVGQMGTHEGMAREAGRSLGYQRRVPLIFIRVQGNQPAIGGFYSGCHLEIAESPLGGTPAPVLGTTPFLREMEIFR